MTVSERIPFSGLLLPLQEGHTYSCDRCTTDGMELLFVFRENGHSRYYFESDMQGFDRKAASDSHILTVYPQPNGDGEVSLLHLKRAATDRFFLFRMTKPCVTLTGEMWLWAGLTAAVTAADYFLPGYMAKLFGGTRAGMVGATVGMIAGLFVGGLIGIVVGPFVGAVAGELLNDRERIGQALVVGVGSFLSFLVGTGIKLVAAVGMLTFVVADTWPALRAWFATVF